MKMRSLACLPAVLLTAVLMAADSPAPKKTDTAAIARRAWVITDRVLEQDIDPPARQQMLLDGLKSLLRHASKPLPTTLADRVSRVTTPEQYADLLADVWPAQENKASADEESPEQVLFMGLMAGWPREGFESAYLSPQQLKMYEVLVGNRYVGTGIQIRMAEKEKLTQILIPFPGGPARKAGARPGDLIVAVDDQSMDGKPLRDVVRCLQGEEGTAVSMTVRQPGESKTRRLAMIRSVIPFTAVHGFRRTGEESWALKPEAKSPIAYLALDDIKSSTPLELRQIEPLVKAENVKALVLDLRFTRGLDHHHAALVADCFLDDGVMWRVRDVHGKVKEHKADRDCLFRDMPLVVLVSSHTGRLGAILAAALQDRGRAILVGQPPNADLTITSLVRLPDEQGALRLRTGIIERTSPKRPDAVENHVVPDHLVAVEMKQLENVMEWRQQQQSPEPKADAKPPADPQLEKALALLREKMKG
jgi:carboxyl-terminal processing protease